jgi:hypothetical protein
MLSWNIEETRELVLALHGKSQFDLVCPCLESVVDRQKYARFHHHETRDILERFVSTRLKDTSLLDLKLDMVLGVDDEAADEFHILSTKIGAHFTACIQSLHAIADILGHALYYALAINLLPKPLKPANTKRSEPLIYAKSVLGQIQDNLELAQVHALFLSLCTGGNFTHLAALVNHSKHRSVVQTSLNEDRMGLASQRYTLKIPRFDHKDTPYPEVSIKDFIEPEYDRCSVLVIEIGNALNAVLRARKCQP